MKAAFDPLYTIFEHHLFNALVENETTDDFLVKVVKDYIERLALEGVSIPHGHIGEVETDLREEVLEMLRKKTYGHFNLTEFRKAIKKRIESPTPQALQKAKARRRRAS